MSSDPARGSAPAGDTPGRLSSEWQAFTARAPRLLRRLIIVVLVVFVICAVPWTYANIKYGNEVEAELQRIRDAAEPLSEVEAAPKPVPDDQNAAILYMQVLHVSFDGSQPANPGKLTFGVLSYQENELLKAYVEDPEATDAAAVRAILARAEVREVLAVFERGSRMPYCVFPVHWEEGFGALFPHMAQLRDAARLIGAQVQVLAANGRMDEAMHWSDVALRMSVQVSSEPSMIAQLVAYAVQAIALQATEHALDQGAPSPAVAKQLADYAASIDLQAPFHRGLLMERASDISIFEAVASDPAQLHALLSDEPPSLWVGVYASPIALPLRRFDEAECLRYWRWALPLMDKPYRLTRGGGSEQEEWLNATPRLAVLTQILYPVFARARAKRDGSIARLDELRVALELKEYRRAWGSYPKSLDALAQTPGWAIPEDVFAGRPFHYRRQGEGFVLWSIGPDLEDDGGIPPKPRSDLERDEADIVWTCTR
ncbi:MAG TPA: hypothetical protein VM283_02300 [Armatimonadota bacterium]|nr:hypothetical protein [Armatimonadota bacterium]